jgi:hypothetical protein
MLNCARLAVSAVVIIGLFGCASARPATELLPPSGFFERPNTSRSPESVQIYREGTNPEAAAVPIANVAAHGNGYADRATLERTLQLASAAVGADGVVIRGMEISSDETVGTYSQGIMISNTIKRPHLYGFAFRWATATIGINYDEEGRIKYVVLGSPADKAGLKEGDEILAINGRFIGHDPFVVAREISTKKAGTNVVVEFKRRGGDKQAVDVVLAGP